MTTVNENLYNIEINFARATEIFINISQSTSNMGGRSSPIFFVQKTLIEAEKDYQDAYKALKEARESAKNVKSKSTYV